MKQVDYIIVGLGIAGIAFCEQLRKNNKTFLVYDDNTSNSSLVAGGVYNPVILKRFTAAWMAKEQLEIAKDFYISLEGLLNTNFKYDMPVQRVFNSVEEQNNWFIASDKPILEDFLSDQLVDNQYRFLNAKYKLGTVLDTGKIDTGALINAYKNHLQGLGLLINERFEYHLAKINSNHIEFNGIVSEKIIFCEGFGLKQNPYFNYLPLTGSKGEILIISAPDLKLDSIIKSSVFLIPLGDDKYYAGATYNNVDKTLNPTKEARDELLNKLNKLISCQYTVVDHLVGIRPTVKDRRPLVGPHPKYKNFYILNGLGTRGVMIAPYVSDQLFEYIENGTSLNPEIDIQRFEDHYVQLNINKGR